MTAPFILIDGLDLSDLFAGESVIESFDGLASFMVVDDVLTMRNNASGDWFFFEHGRMGLRPSEFEFASVPDTQVLGAAGFGAFTEIFGAGYNLLASGLSAIPDAGFQSGFSAVDKTLRPDHYKALEDEKNAREKANRTRKAGHEKAKREKAAGIKRRDVRRKERETRRKVALDKRRAYHASKAAAEARLKFDDEQNKAKLSRKPGTSLKVSIRTTILGYLAARSASKGRNIEFVLGGQTYELEV